MKLRSLTVYSISPGHRRTIRLYKVWRSMLGRLKGHSTSRKGNWRGQSHGFYDWADFREWALSTGYRAGVELDRIERPRGYARSNLQWLPTSEHKRKSANERWHGDEP